MVGPYIAAHPSHECEHRLCFFFYDFLPYQTAVAGLKLQHLCAEVGPDDYLT